MYRDCKMVICCVGFDEEYEVYGVTSNVYQVEWMLMWLVCCDYRGLWSVMNIDV